MAHFTDNTVEELRIRCDALRGLLFAESGLELHEIAAVEDAALSELLPQPDVRDKRIQK